MCLGNIQIFQSKTSLSFVQVSFYAVLREKYYTETTFCIHILNPAKCHFITIELCTANLHQEFRRERRGSHYVEVEKYSCS
jgi:hypothetical protein